MIHSPTEMLFGCVQDVRWQLYNDEDDRTFFGWIQSELRSVDKRLEEGRATLQHLEMHLINVACDDPGATIGAQLALPMLQERLDAQAREFADRRATEAELLIVQMEVGIRPRCSHSLTTAIASPSSPAL